MISLYTYRIDSQIEAHLVFLGGHSKNLIPHDGHGTVAVHQ